jgi:hypothetical protein
MDYERLSEYAKHCVDKYAENNTIYIIDYKEKLDHDGYDKDGPESDLWDLFIMYTSKVSGEDVLDFVDWYHWENWFTKDTVKGYTLHKTFNMNKLRQIPEGSRKIIENQIVKMFGYHN